MGWTDEDGSTVYYGEDDYKKARKVLDNPNSYKLLRDRLDPTLCYLGKPVMWWFDKEWEIQTDRLKAYLDIYDVSQETNIDAIMDFMPEIYTYSHHFEASGEPGTEYYCEAFTHDYRESNKEELLELWAHEKGFLGFMQDKIDRFLSRSYDLAGAKAFNRLCRSQGSEQTNNAIIAEHILTEALEPVSDSDYQAALDRLNKGLDNGTYIEQDYREEKGLPTNNVDTVQTNPDSGQASFDAFCESENPTATDYIQDDIVSYTKSKESSNQFIGFLAIFSVVCLMAWSAS